MSDVPPLACTTCSRRAECRAICPEVSLRLPAPDRGRIAGLASRHRLLYGARLERRRSYVRFLLDWRDVLRGRLRMVFDLRYDHGLSLVEIGRRLGISASTARDYLARARQRIENAAKKVRNQELRDADDVSA